MSGTVRLRDDSYEHFARVYDEAGFDRFSIGLEGSARRAIERLEAPRVADLACGTGSLLARLAPSVSLAVGVDASPAMVRRAAEKGSTARFLAGTLRALPLRGPFDLLLCVYDSLNYEMDRASLAAAFREARRVASPKARMLFDTNDRLAFESIWGSPEPYVAETNRGRLVIRSTWDASRGVGEAEVVVEVPHDEGGGVYASRHRQRYHTPSDVEEALAASGWEAVRREPIDPFPGEEVLPGGKTLWTACPRGAS